MLAATTLVMYYIAIPLYSLITPHVVCKGVNSTDPHFSPYKHFLCQVCIEKYYFGCCILHVNVLHCFTCCTQGVYGTPSTYSKSRKTIVPIAPFPELVDDTSNSVPGCHTSEGVIRIVASLSVSVG